MLAAVLAAMVSNSFRAMRFLLPAAGSLTRTHLLADADVQRSASRSRCRGALVVQAQADLAAVTRS